MTGNQDTSSEPRLGKSGRLPGYLLFMKVNATLACQGLDPALTPTDRPSFDVNPVAELVITNTGGAIDLKLSVPSAPATDILVLGTHPRSPGVTFAKHFTILGRLPAAVRRAPARHARLHSHPAGQQRLGRFPHPDHRHRPQALTRAGAPGAPASCRLSVSKRPAEVRCRHSTLLLRHARSIPAESPPFEPLVPFGFLISE
jgi:hypothetical protein